MANQVTEKGYEIIEPLWHWSEFNRLASEFSREVGKSFARELSGNHPEPKTMAEIKEHLKGLIIAYKAASTMGIGLPAVPAADG